MIVAFGTSTPTSITVVATRTSSSPALKRAITLAPLGRPQPPVEAADAVAAELGRCEAARPRPRRRGATRVSDCLDQRADDVRLPPVVEVPAETRVRLRAALLGRPTRVIDRLAVRRRQRELADLEVAVDGERERARDRRRGQVEDVRAPALDERACAAPTPKRCCSSTTATARSRKSTSFWMSACVPTTSCASPEAMSCRAAACSCARSELVSSDDADAERRAQLVDGEEVLLGEGLGRRHERALAPDLDRAEERVERDDGLPRADVALEEALHRNRALEVGVDLGDRALLIRRERERERRAVARDELARLAERLRPTRCSRAAAVRASASRRTSSSSNASRTRPTSASASDARPVDGGERIGAERKPLATRAASAGSRLADVADELERLRVEVAELLLREILGGRVDGREVGGLRLAVEVVRGHGEPVAVRAAAKADRACPATSFASSHGWLNHVALISPVSSATRAVRILSRPRRRLVAERTTPSITASSSPKRSQIRFVGTGSS